MGRSACREAVSSKETQRSALLRITSPYIGLIRYRSAMVLRALVSVARFSFLLPAAAPKGRRTALSLAPIKSNNAPDRARSSAEDHSPPPVPAHDRCHVHVAADLSRNHHFSLHGHGPHIFRPFLAPGRSRPALFTPPPSIFLPPRPPATQTPRPLTAVLFRFPPPAFLVPAAICRHQLCASVCG